MDKSKFLNKEVLENEFWYSNSTGIIKFDKLKLAEYLESIGVYRYYTTDTDYILVRVVDNIIDFIDVATVKHLVVDYVKPVGEKVLGALQATIGTLISDVSLQLLSRKDVEVFQGEKDTIYIFYKDKIAVIKKDGFVPIQYKDFHHLIWRSVVMDRNFPVEASLQSNESGVFEKFFYNVFKNPDNRKYVQQVFGYALQRYRKLSNMRAVILNDDNIDDQAKGGTGKGIIYQALKQFMPGVKENGKAYRPDKQFSFQNLNLDTRLCFLDDVSPKFDITQLFSVITDGLYIEKKNQQPFWIDATNAPLFLISSNYGISGSDDSHLRRRYDIGLDKHYHSKFSPENDFGHQFFREWDKRPNEWTLFDLFMIENAQAFLKSGVEMWINPNLEKKQFIADTHIDFEEFAEAYPFNTEIKKDITLEDLRKLTNKPKLSMNLMTRWNKKFAELNMMEYEEVRREKTFIMRKGMFNE